MLGELSIPHKGNNEYFFPSHLDVLVGHLQRVHALVRPHLLGQPELGVVDVDTHDEPAWGNKKTFSHYVWGNQAPLEI